MPRYKGEAMKKATGKKEASKVLISRPYMPMEYGLPKDKKGLLPWSYVVERMSEAMHYWICTVSPDHRPHATPVDGLWLEDKLYFGGSPETRWQRNLESNPAMQVHLESTTKLLILRGEAKPLKGPAKELTVTLSKASKEKYGYAAAPEQYAKAGIFVFQAQVVLAWKQFPKDATRWQF
jgi:hypothetical protein